MRSIIKSSQFKRDFKRIQHDEVKVRELFDVVQKLANNETLPKKYKAHQLSGKYKQFMECHIEDDFLLIWYDKEKATIKLVRLGTHSELFK